MSTKAKTIEGCVHRGAYKATYTVTPSWGYEVDGYMPNGDGSALLHAAHYQAGDARLESQAFGTGELDAATLEGFARDQCEEIIDEMVDAKVRGRLVASDIRV